MSAVQRKRKERLTRKDKRRESINGFRFELRINALMQNISDSISNECLKEVVDLFGGSKAMLRFILKHAKFEKLEEIYQIATKYKIKSETNNILNYFQFVAENKIESISVSKNKKDLFNILPNECISNICNYLDKFEINEFKKCSRTIAIVCFAEMNKISVCILSLNTLISPNYIHQSIMQNNRNHGIECTRHKPSKPMYSLQQEWQTKYEIPKQNQLLFIRKYEWFPYKMVNFHKHSLLKIKPQKSLLINTDKLVILNQNEARLFDTNTDNMDNIYHFKLMILQYFDVKQQAFTFAQCILYHPNISYQRLFDYIEKEYIIINGVDNEWYVQLKRILKEMDNHSYQPKMAIFRHTYNNRIVRISNFNINHRIHTAWSNDNANKFVFQINPNHPWFNQHSGTNDTTNEFYEIKQKCKERYDVFECRADEYFINHQSVTIYIKNDKELLKSCINKYYRLKLNKIEREIFKAEIDKIFTIIDKGYITLINVSIPMRFLKIKLAKIFDNIFDAKYFELYNHDCENNTNRIYKSDECVSISSRLGFFPRISMSCSIVFYDTLSIATEIVLPVAGVELYNIGMYKPSEAPTPFLDINIGKKITIRFKARFMVKHLVNYLFDLIKSCDHMLCDEFKEFIALCDDGLSFVVTNRREKFAIQYTMNDRYDSNEGKTNLNLFMIREKPFETLRNIQLKLKFVSNNHKGTKYKLNIKTDMKNINGLDYVGLALNVWIHSNDSLETIIRKNLEKAKECIVSCYRVNIKDKKIMSIAKSNWMEYRPYWRFIWSEPNDFLIFKVKQSKKYYLPRFNNIQ